MIGVVEFVTCASDHLYFPLPLKFDSSIFIYLSEYSLEKVFLYKFIPNAGFSTKILLPIVLLGYLFNAVSDLYLVNQGFSF